MPPRRARPKPRCPPHCGCHSADGRCCWCRRPAPPRRCPHGGHITETDAQVCGLHRERDALRARAEAAEKALAQERRWHDRDHRIREKAMTRFEEEQDRAEAAEAALRTHEAVWEHAEGCMAGCDPDADDWCEVARDLSREAAVLRRKVLAAIARAIAVATIGGKP